MILSQLIYFSEKRDLGPGGVAAILDSARRENERRHLTGALIFNQTYFLQCLEGGRKAITETFSKIAKDPRHDDITLISVHDIDVRDFPDWTMGYVVSTSPELKSALREVLPTPDFSPVLLGAAATLTLMKRMRSMQQTG